MTINEQEKLVNRLATVQQCDGRSRSHLKSNSIIDNVCQSTLPRVFSRKKHAQNTIKSNEIEKQEIKPVTTEQQIVSRLIDTNDEEFIKSLQQVLEATELVGTPAERQETPSLMGDCDLNSFKNHLQIASLEFQSLKSSHKIKRMSERTEQSLQNVLSHHKQTTAQQQLSSSSQRQPTAEIQPSSQDHQEATPTLQQAKSRSVFYRKRTTTQLEEIMNDFEIDKFQSKTSDIETVISQKENTENSVRSNMKIVDVLRPETQLLDSAKNLKLQSLEAPPSRLTQISKESQDFTAGSSTKFEEVKLKAVSPKRRRFRRLIQKNQKSILPLLTFSLCCLKTEEQLAHEAPFLHWHEMHGTMKKRASSNVATCTPEQGKIYNTVQLAMECVTSKVIKDIERFNRIKPIILEHRVQIEADLKKVSKGKWPAPYLVLDRLLRPESPKQLNNTQQKSSFFRTALNQASGSPSNSNKFQVHNMEEKLTDEQKTQNLKQWQHTPLYKQTILKKTEMESILESVPEAQIQQLVSLSVDEQQPDKRKIITSKLQKLEMTLSRQLKQQELEYFFHLLEHRDELKTIEELSNEEMMHLYEQSSLTLLVQLVNIGRFSQYSSIMKEFAVQKGQKNDLRVLLHSLMTRINAMYAIINSLKKVFRGFQKHKDLLSKFNAAMVQQQQENFCQIKLIQPALDVLVIQAAKLCKKVNTLVDEAYFPKSSKGRTQLIIEGKCMRQIVLDNISQVYESWKDQLQIKLFKTNGDFI